MGLDPDQLLARLQRQFPEAILEGVVARGTEATALVKRDQLLPVATFCRDDAELQFDHLSDIASVDWPGRPERFDVVYHLYSIPANHRLRLKIHVPDEEAVESVTGVWPAADWLEREVYDLMGVRFANHPNLTRIMMWEGYPFHPLRKEFPTEGEPDVPADYNVAFPPGMERQ
ncbi:MAG TPA: NADH-quinone oxidoreductase subunit C [Chloroflexota bacterium]|nr:NADH-quinone oxidoreductase subunit C [Chloroflexota bacterium]